MATWAALRGAIQGEVLVPGMAAYEEVRRPAIERFWESRPQAVVRCVTADDVAKTIAFAKAAGLPTVTRSGGHCFAGRSSTDGVVIDVRPMRSIGISDRRVRVGSGARLGEVYDALHAHRLTMVAGCGPEVGIAGLTLGGGIGLLGRIHGLVSDNLLSARVVLADGSEVECDESREPDLFWALRGAGGGMFGVVTSLVFRVLPEPVATSLRLSWRYADAAAVLSAWQSWAPDAPDGMHASLLVKTPAAPDREPTVDVFGAMIGTESETVALLDELIGRVGSQPITRACRQASYREVKKHLVELGGTIEGPEGAVQIRSEYFAQDLSDAAIDDLLTALAEDRIPGQGRELDFSPQGGGYGRPAPDATAFVHRDARFLLKHVVSDGPAARDWLDRSVAAVGPCGTGRAYQNFPDPDLTDWASAYYGSNYARLQRVKAHYDPENFFRFHQSVQPLR